MEYNPAIIVENNPDNNPASSQGHCAGGLKANRVSGHSSTMKVSEWIMQATVAVVHMLGTRTYGAFESVEASVSNVRTVPISMCSEKVQDIAVFT